MKKHSKTFIVLMATIKYSALVSDIRGIVGGNVFSRNKGGGYVRSFTKPTNPQTPGQEAVRQNLTVLSSGWRDLGEEIRLAWNAAAANFPQTNKMGETVYLSGQQLYLKFNSTLLNAGLSIVETAPSPAEIPACPFSMGTVDDSTFEVDFGSLSLSADYKVIIQATRPMSAGTSNAFRSDFKTMVVIAGTAATGIVDYVTNYELNISALAGAAGKKIYVRALVVVAASGQANVPVTASAIVS